MTSTPPITHVDAAVGDAPGQRARIGLILLATDFATEGELARFLPDGRGADADVAWFTTRVPNTNPVTAANLRAMGPELARTAANILPGARLDAIAYSCTSGTVVMGAEATRAQINAGRPWVPVTTPAIAALAAFDALGVRRLSVLTPYSPEVNAAIADFLIADGCDIRTFASFHLDTDEAMSGVPERAIAEAAAGADTPDSDAVFISCTALRAVGCVAELEARLGKPVVTSNQAMFWHALRLAGVADAVPGRGTLLQLGLNGTPAGAAPA
jgi:maleate isomerase